MANRQPTSRVSGVLIPMIPVADLSRSVAFYTTLLGLELRREFVQDGRVTGAALGGSDLDFGLNLRLAATLAGPPTYAASTPSSGGWTTGPPSRNSEVTPTRSGSTLWPGSTTTPRSSGW